MDKTSWDAILGPGFLAKVLFSVLIPLVLVAFFLSAEQLGWPNNRMGIHPRSLSGLQGVVFWPILHGDGFHLANNCISLFMGLLLSLVLYPNYVLRVILWTWLMGGLLVWAFAGGGYHIGASGIIYGLTGFLLTAGIARRSARTGAAALAVLFLNQGFFMGFVPEQGISWEGHLFGALVGAACALVWRPLPGLVDATDDAPPPPTDDDTDDGPWNYRNKL